MGAIVAVALNARFTGGQPSGTTSAQTTSGSAAPADAARTGPARPSEIRGVHVTGPLIATGRLDSYIALSDSGLNTLQVDLKDESGDVMFTQAPALAREIGAARDFYDARKLARKVHAAGLYLIGRVVVFADPRLASARPGLSLRAPGGGVWEDSAGWRWTSQYSRAVWDYNVSIAAAAVRAGFDEIMFDYIRFPYDRLTGVGFADRVSEPKWRTIARFAQYAADELHPLGTRVGAAVFGLAATRDLGIGQRPQLLAKYLDTLYPMTYPCLYGPGWYGIDEPWAHPGLTVSWSLSHFTKRLAGSGATIVPWLEDYDCTGHGVEYSPALLSEQTSAARRAMTDGYLLWNATGEYTSDALAQR